MNIACKVKDAENLGRCLRLMQNSMASCFSLICRAKSQRGFINTCERIYSGAYAAFPISQSRAYTLKIFNYPFDTSYGIEFDMTYMYGEKETKEIRCAAAKIAEKLLASLPGKSSKSDRIHAVCDYMKKNYTYCMTGDFRDHSAYSLLQKKRGVCQAFAALTSLILPFMGIPCLYIGGEGLSNNGWVPHGWNCVRLEEGRWEHLDITYSLNSLVLHTTATAIGKAVFDKSHRYTQELYSNEVLERVYREILDSIHSKVTLDSNDNRFYAYGSTFYLQSGEPLLMYVRGKYGVDISELFFLLGGATVYSGENDTLMLCLYDSIKYIKNASQYMLGDGYFDVRILKEAGISLSANGSKLELQI